MVEGRLQSTSSSKELLGTAKDKQTKMTPGHEVAPRSGGQ